MPTYRSVRGRARARGAVGTAAWSGSLLGKRKRVGMPVARRLRRGTVSRRSMYASGIPGATGRYVAGVGREVPLYLPSRRSRTEAHIAEVLPIDVQVNTTGSLQFLNTVPTGTSLYAREGQRITMTQLQIRGFIRVDAATTYAAGSLLIVYDKAPRGALPVPTDILDLATTQSFQKLDTRDRFEILFRKNYSLEGNNTTVTADSFRNIDEVVYMNRSATYTLSGAGGTIADISYGALYAFWIGNVGAGTNDLIAHVGYRTVFSP